MQAGEQRWRRRPVAAFLIIAVVRLLPVLASFVSGILLGNLTGRPSGLVPTSLWLLGLLVVSTVVLVLVDRVASRALPLASLFRLSLLVPDKTPSRFKIALTSHNTRHLLQKAPKEPGQSAAMVLGLISQLNSHDRRTRGHSERVRAYTDLLAEEMRISDRDRDLLRWAGLLHDIGKLRVSTATLNKPGKPNDREWEELKRHPAEGAKIIAPLKPWLGHWASAVVQHHERWDGKGYPGGLAGLQISLGGRIVAVADAFETMTAVRAYKPAMSLEAAREELVRCAGAHFDPVVVRAFMRLSLGRLRVLMGPLAWIAEQPFLAGVGQAGARVATAGTKVGVGVATVGAVAGAAVSGGLPELSQRSTTVTTSVPIEVEVEGRGLIDTFLRQRFITTSSTSTTTSSTSSTTTTVVPDHGLWLTEARGVGSPVMQAISAIGSATSGISASLQDLAASAHNIANLQTAKPTDGPAFQGEQVIQTENPAGGVSTSIAPQGTAEGVVLSAPEHPAADAQGLVRYPNIDIAAEMVNVVVAQRAVEANVATIHGAIDTYRVLLAMTSSDRVQLTSSTSG